MGSQIEKRLTLDENAEALAVFGRNDQYLRMIEDDFDVDILPRGNQVVLIGPGEEVEKVASVISHLVSVFRAKKAISGPDVAYSIRLAKDNEADKLAEVSDAVVTTIRGKNIVPKTLGQKGYVRAIAGNGIVFGIGPAGTGKTYLAVAMAVEALKSREVERIILTRPAVEAGESLGFLPGDLREKVDPYLRPLYDALYNILGGETYQKYIERGSIEIAPLAYMRGRTLDNSFIILDEAQNTTPEQMKMFLTRLGFGSKAVVTGDITQIDLPRGKSSGLKQVIEILSGIKGIEFVYLTDRDVVRHPLVQKIVQAYERFEQERSGKQGRR